jgi:PAS domain-containing protein
MVLDKLIDKILRTAIEHADAQRGLLIFPTGEELRVEAEATKAGEEVTVCRGESVRGAAALPESVLRCVARTQQAVLLDDTAAPNAFFADSYIARHAARSMLCLPLLNGGKLIGLLCLENDLAAGVFAPARITVLKLLASQAATSLENIRLYRALFALDLTARKRAEQALRQNEAYLAEAQRLTHTGSWAFNPVSGEVTYWSDEMFRIYGMGARRNRPPTRDEQIQLTHPEDRARNAEAIGIAIHEKTGFTLEYRHVMADGTVRHLHSVGHPVLEKTGALVEFVGKANVVCYLIKPFSADELLASVRQVLQRNDADAGWRQEQELCGICTGSAAMSASCCLLARRQAAGVSPVTIRNCLHRCA